MACPDAKDECSSQHYNSEKHRIRMETIVVDKQDPERKKKNALLKNHHLISLKTKLKYMTDLYSTVIMFPCSEMRTIN